MAKAKKVPDSVKAILRGHLTSREIGQWWRSYLRLDPDGQEGHAEEQAHQWVDEHEKQAAK